MTLIHHMYIEMNLKILHIESREHVDTLIPFLNSNASMRKQMFCEKLSAVGLDTIRKQHQRTVQLKIHYLFKPLHPVKNSQLGDTDTSSISFKKSTTMTSYS